MAKRKRRRANEPEPYPGWMWMLFGLAIGLSVAFAIYMKDRRPAPVAAVPQQQPASLSAALDSPEPEATEAEAEPEEPRFSFYDMLPNFEVIIPEQEPDVAPDTTAQTVEEPGVYVLQVGSFSEFSDADRRRAQLALLGIESRVQRVTIDDRTYHRVRIGPMSDLTTLNTIRSRLRQADIDVLRIRLGD